MKAMLFAVVAAVTMGAGAYAPAKSPLVPSGLSGFVYTQTTDVEIETNGLLTYDRKVLKFDPAVLRTAHERMNRAIGR